MLQYNFLITYYYILVLQCIIILIQSCKIILLIKWMHICTNCCDDVIINVCVLTMEGLAHRVTPWIGFLHVVESEDP